MEGKEEKEIGKIIKSGKKPLIKVNPQFTRQQR